MDRQTPREAAAVDLFFLAMAVIQAVERRDPVT